MPYPLDNIAQEFRSAVLASDHTLAERLASEYARSASQAWESLSESERDTSALPAQARELLTWARGMTIVQRALLAEQIAILEKASHYWQAPAARRNSTMQVSV